MDISLVSVNPSNSRHCERLYDFLRERIDHPDTNISHKRLPLYGEHCLFVAERPYFAWCLIQEGEEAIGSIYLTRNDEIGIFIMASHQGKGIGEQAIRLLMKSHRRDSYFANINPQNERSIAFFKRLGGKCIQHTYEIPCLTSLPK